MSLRSAFCCVSFSGLDFFFLLFLHLLVFCFSSTIYLLFWLQYYCVRPVAKTPTHAWNILDCQVLSRVAKTFSSVVDLGAITLTISRDQPRCDSSPRTCSMSAATKRCKECVRCGMAGFPRTLCRLRRSCLSTDMLGCCRYAALFPPPAATACCTPPPCDAYVWYLCIPVGCFSVPLICFFAFSVASRLKLGWRLPSRHLFLGPRPRLR